MLAEFRAIMPKDPRGDNEILNGVESILRSGLVPAAVRGVMYKALALLPDLVVTDASVNLDGHIGVALAVDDPENGRRDEFIVDPNTGQYIGDREVTLRDYNDGIKAGTVMGLTSITTVVVDRMGATTPG
jgi:hypothetical protein